MRSIRLSLVIYFLALLAGALGAVSWLVYGTVGRSLHEKEESMVKEVNAEFAVQRKEREDELDRHIARQARALTNKVKITPPRFEGLYPFGMFGASLAPQGPLFALLWAAEGAYPKLMAEMRRGAADFSIESPEKMFSAAPQAREYFQLNGTHGNVQRSESLEGHQFPLTEDGRSHLAEDEPKFDDLMLTPDLKVRLVTLKERMRPDFHFPPGTIVWFEKPKTIDKRDVDKREIDRKDFDRKDFDRKDFDRKDRERKIREAYARSGKTLRWPVFGKPGKQPPPPPPPPPFSGKTPSESAERPDFSIPAIPIYVQYASDTNVLNDDIRKLEAVRDEQIADLAKQTQADLDALRRQLVWISLITFAGILVGSLLLIHMGLAPLNRLSTAVSKVSARDFKLKVDVNQLPRELLPIADRLQVTLSDLRKAFAREKQAAADISHELRTPLSALLTTIELALRKPRSAADYREMFQDCQFSGQQMMHLVERLLALARLDAGAERLRPTTVDVADLANQCAGMVRPLAEAKGISLSVHTDNGVPVQADGGKLREIMNNLLHNAIQYNKPQGSVDLNVRHSAGRLSIQVRDTGIGIAPEARAHLFERFYRADPSRHSDTPHAGLGLSIVKSYVDLMKGHIDVDTNGGATTFTVEIPA